MHKHKQTVSVWNANVKVLSCFRSRLATVLFSVSLTLHRPAFFSEINLNNNVAGYVVCVRRRQVNRDVSKGTARRSRAPAYEYADVGSIVFLESRGVGLASFPFT